MRADAFEVGYRDGFEAQRLRIAYQASGDGGAAFRAGVAMGQRIAEHESSIPAVPLCTDAHRAGQFCGLTLGETSVPDGLPSSQAIVWLAALTGSGASRAEITRAVREHKPFTTSAETDRARADMVRLGLLTSRRAGRGTVYDVSAA
jgi:hypothetical protein